MSKIRVQKHGLNTYSIEFSAKYEASDLEHKVVVPVELEDLRELRNCLDRLISVDRSERPVSVAFMQQMTKNLNNARARGLVGWDQHWQDTHFPSPPGGPTGYLMGRLLEETVELALALDRKNKVSIVHEAADVANFAMFIADYEAQIDGRP